MTDLVMDIGYALNAEPIEANHTRKFTPARAQIRAILIHKGTKITAQTANPALRPRRFVCPAPHPSAMSEPVSLATCIRELAEHLGCTCDPTHLDAGGFDRGCRVHDIQERS